MSTRLKLLFCSASFASSYGGPARSVSGLVEALVAQGCEVGIWAPDGSGVKNSFLHDGTKVTRFGQHFEESIRDFGSIDVVHDSGLWLPHNHAIAVYCRKQGVRRVVSTRGMLEPWAREHKRLKKWLAWNAYQRSDLKRADAIHVTGELEAESIASLGFPDPWIVPNGIHFPAEEIESTIERRAKNLHDNETRTALFLGRLHPVKGLPMLLKAWLAVRPKKWKLRIVGPDESGHRRDLEAFIAKNSLRQEVTVLDAVNEIQKWHEMAQADLFVCPSYSENFGIAIAEAMASGLPVVTTTGTPWESIKLQEMGWWVEPTVESIGDALRAATNASAEHLARMGAASSQFVRSRFTWDRVGADMLAHYDQLLSR